MSSDRHQTKPYPLRISDDLRDRLEESAKAMGRSLNAEIASRLEESFAPKSMDDMSIRDVIDESVRRSIEEAKSFLLHTRVEHVKPKSQMSGGTTNLMFMSELEHELLALDETSHKLLSHANAIALEQGEGSSAYQRVMKHSSDLKRMEAGLRETLDIIAQTARAKGASPNRKTKS